MNVEDYGVIDLENFCQRHWRPTGRSYFFSKPYQFDKYIIIFNIYFPTKL